MCNSLTRVLRQVAILSLFLCKSALAQSTGAPDVHFVWLGGDDCPPCVEWRKNELPKLRQSAEFARIKFSYVQKPIRSPIPASIFLPAEVKPFKDKLDFASNSHAGSPQAALLINGEVFDFFTGTRSARSLTSMLDSILRNQPYPFVRCTRMSATFGVCDESIVDSKLQAGASRGQPTALPASDYTCRKADDEESRKVCTDLSASVYLKENFQIAATAALAASTKCDWTAPITKGKSGTTSGFSCEGSHPGGSISVGWVSASEKNVDILKLLVERGGTSFGAKVSSWRCTDRKPYLALQNAVAGGLCSVEFDSVSTINEANGIFIATVFLKPKNVVHRRFFVTVLSKTSPQDAENVLASLIH